MKLRLARALEAPDRDTARIVFKRFGTNLKMPGMTAVYEITTLDRALHAVFPWGLDRFIPEKQILLWPQNSSGGLVDTLGTFCEGFSSTLRIQHYLLVRCQITLLTICCQNLLGIRNTPGYVFDVTPDVDREVICSRPLDLRFVSTRAFPRRRDATELPLRRRPEIGWRAGFAFLRAHWHVTLVSYSAHGQTSGESPLLLG